MLIEVKAKVARIIEGKTRKRTETFLIEKEFFSEAEYAVMELLTTESNSHLIESFDIPSLRVSSIKELCLQYQGDSTYIVSLKDVFLTDEGAEKPIKYKILLWANSLSEANHRAQEIAEQGYDMHIEGIKEVEYEYLTGDSHGQDEE